MSRPRIKTTVSIYESEKMIRLSERVWELHRQNSRLSRHRRILVAALTAALVALAAALAAGR